MAIEKFEGDYRFLSNFHPCEIIRDGDKYASVEHAYQAAKTIDFEERARLQSWNEQDRLQSAIPHGEQG